MNAKRVKTIQKSFYVGYSVTFKHNTPPGRCVVSDVEAVVKEATSETLSAPGFFTSEKRAKAYGKKEVLSFFTKALKHSNRYIKDETKRNARLVKKLAKLMKT